jgi:TolB-like protein/DNA-binding winged helix-turn-helix (wHTH) protein/tetratricopeptide (TPR) repeat protein
MTANLSKTYVLGAYRLEPDRQLLLAGEQQVHMPKKPFQVLLYLIEHRDRFVNTAELLEQFWPGKDVYDDTARKTVAVLRKALNDNSDKPHFIETRWGYGYRYVGPFAEQMIQSAPQPHEPAATHEASDFGPDAELPAEAATSEREAPQAIPTPPNARPATKLHPRTLALLAGILTLGVFAAALLVQRGRAVPTAARKPEASAPLSSVAVLPLKNLTNDTANDYLCDGITENLINTLSKINGLKVIARGSAFSLKAADADPRELGQRLGVATLLQGGVFKEGERLRVEVRLVSTEDGRVLWAGAPYDRKLGDIFALQDEITRNVIGGLEYKLSVDEERRLTARRTDSVEAYEAYLKGRYHWYKRTKDDLNQSLSYFQEALRHDPNYAQAYAGVADYYNMGVWFLSLPPQEATTKAKAAAQRAVALDDGLAEAHLALARAYRLDWAWADGAHEIEHALEIDPGSAEAHHDYAYVLLLSGQTERAIAEIKQARELDPLSVVMNVDVGEVLLYARRYDEATAALRHAIELDPNRANAHWDLARALQMQGADREAFEEYVRTATLDGEPPEATGALREADNGAGLRGFWQKQLELKLARARHDYVPPSVLAWHYAQLGDHDHAFACLEQAYREHSPIIADLKLDPLLDPLRADPRFAQLATRVGL